MKKIFSTIVMVLVVISSMNAQVTKPKVNIHTTQLNSTPAVQGLEVRNLDKMTVAEFKRLKIPLAQITKEKLKARSTKTWKITPLKPSDNVLKLEYVKGQWRRDSWEIGSGVVNEHTEGLIASSRADFREHGGNARPGGGEYYIFPYTLKFRVSAGVEYRLKIKYWRAGSDKSIYLGIDSFLAEVQFDSNSEINHLFKLDNSGDISILISPQLNRSRRSTSNPISLYPSVITEIIIERIE